MSDKTFTFPGSFITRVVDGDSLRVDAPWVTEQPFYARPSRTEYPIALRVAGVDCDPGGTVAEQTHKATVIGRRAYERTRELTEGKTLTVVTYEQYAYRGPKGTVGEWVGDVQIPYNDRDLPVGAWQWLSTILLDEGLAVPYDGKGKRPSALKEDS